MAESGVVLLDNEDKEFAVSIAASNLRGVARCAAMCTDSLVTWRKYKVSRQRMRTKEGLSSKGNRFPGRTIDNIMVPSSPLVATSNPWARRDAGRRVAPLCFVRVKFFHGMQLQYKRCRAPEKNSSPAAGRVALVLRVGPAYFRLLLQSHQHLQTTTTPLKPSP